MIILSTGTLYSYGLCRVFALAAEVGFDGIELMVDDRWDTRHPAYLRELSATYALPVVALHSPIVFRVPDWPPGQWERLQRTTALAQELGASVVVTHLPLKVYGVIAQVHGFGYRRWMLPIPLPWRRREAQFYALQDGRLQELERTSGITIAVENMPARRLGRWRISITWFNTPAELTRFPHLTMDTTHLGTWGLDPVEVFEQLGDRVAHVHLSNFDGREHRAPYDGHLQLDTLLHRLAARGYRGAISIEGHPDAFNAEDEGKCRDTLARALAFCREHFAP